MYEGMHDRPSRGHRPGPALDPVRGAMRWLNQRSMAEKTGLGACAGILVRSAIAVWRSHQWHHTARDKCGIQALILLYYIIEDHDVLFILSEACHLAGLGILIYKLQQKRSAAGESSWCTDVSGLTINRQLDRLQIFQKRP